MTWRNHFCLFLLDYFAMRANLGPEGQPQVDSAQESLLGFILMLLADLGSQGCFPFPNTDSLVPAPKCCTTEGGTWEQVFLIGSLCGL